jgi:hypothetical protein
MPPLTRVNRTGGHDGNDRITPSGPLRIASRGHSRQRRWQQTRPGNALGSAYRFALYHRAGVQRAKPGQRRTPKGPTGTSC